MPEAKPPRDNRARNLIFLLVALAGILYGLATL
jgi:hypothetical protein